MVLCRRCCKFVQERGGREHAVLVMSLLRSVMLDGGKAHSIARI